MALRTAMEQLQRDVTRAGFLAVSDTSLMLDCGGNVGVPGAGTDSVTPVALSAVDIGPNASLVNTGVSALLGTLWKT